jgi:hypothetical protein
MSEAKVILAVTLLLVSSVLASSCQYLPDSCKFWEEDGAPVRVGAFTWRDSLPGLEVALTPTSRTQASRDYVLDLFERGLWRGSTTVKWDEAELNGEYIKYAQFVLNRPEDAEYRYRSRADLADIFSVRIQG